MKFDLEDTLLRIEAVLKENLNTQITAINTEKADGISLKQISSDAYFLQSMNERMANYDPYVVCAIEDIQSSGLGHASSLEIRILAAICVSDQGEDLNISRRMLRYSRALREAFEAGWSDIGGISQRMILTSQIPIQFQLLDSGQYFRAVGVDITVGLA